MSIADHRGRFSPQLALGLECDAPCRDTAPPRLMQSPTLDGLASAALLNATVQLFIRDRLPTWSAEGVRRNPPCYLVYQHGEVFGSVEDLAVMIRHAEKRRGLGRVLGIRALRPHDDVLPYTIGIRWGPSHPRRFRYEQRMALKALLARRDRAAVGSAMQRSQGRFLAWAAARPGLASRVKDATGLTLVSFWRAVRGLSRQFRPPSVVDAYSAPPDAHGFTARGHFLSEPQSHASR